MDLLISQVKHRNSSFGIHDWSIKEASYDWKDRARARSRRGAHRRGCSGVAGRCSGSCRWVSDAGGLGAGDGQDDRGLAAQPGCPPRAEVSRTDQPPLRGRTSPPTQQDTQTPVSTPGPGGSGTVRAAAGDRAGERELAARHPGRQAVRESPTKTSRSRKGCPWRGPGPPHTGTSCRRRPPSGRAGRSGCGQEPTGRREKDPGEHRPPRSRATRRRSSCDAEDPPERLRSVRPWLSQEACSHEGHEQSAQRQSEQLSPPQFAHAHVACRHVGQLQPVHVHVAQKSLQSEHAQVVHSS